ncbi:MAG: nucleoside triphosphate pyrophosphohydrolase [Candidatus Thorarchaeota archaeon]|nr:MAG: nucleoside triphosphate pyrophosphohydrolase [Candidatus Thorarchaeota archaeon]
MSEKLVRDLIPEIITSDGETANVRIASGDELDVLLRAKIVEEAKEFLKSGTAEEIADILEAIGALLALRKVSWDEINRIREEKLEKKGGFTKGYVLTMENDT